jgi:dipeptidyl aminopeptidase/acylaminoacyl peptidase
LTIAQAPIVDLVAADHANLSDDGDAVRRWMGCVHEGNEEIWRKVNPIENLPKSAVLLMHGKADDEVPWTQSESYINSMEEKGEEIQKLWLPGDHFSLIDVASDDWLAQVEAIREWL